MSKVKATSALNSTARSAIAASFCDALATMDNSGSMLTHVCDTARQYMHGKPIPDDDRKAITEKIAHARGWKGDAIRARSSEVGVILKAYAQLPEAVKALGAAVKRCNWHDAMKLARRLNKGDSISKAVAFAKKKGSGVIVPPSGRVAGALKAWYKEARADKRKAILEAAELLGLKLGVQV